MGRRGTETILSRFSFGEIIAELPSEKGLNDLIIGLNYQQGQLKQQSSSSSSQLSAIWPPSARKAAYAARSKSLARVGTAPHRASSSSRAGRLNTAGFHDELHHSHTSGALLRVDTYEFDAPQLAGPSMMMPIQPIQPVRLQRHRRGQGKTAMPPGGQLPSLPLWSRSASAPCLHDLGVDSAAGVDGLLGPQPQPPALPPNASLATPAQLAATRPGARAQAPSAPRSSPEGRGPALFLDGVEPPPAAAQSSYGSRPGGPSAGPSAGPRAGPNGSVAPAAGRPAAAAAPAPAPLPLAPPSLAAPPPLSTAAETAPLPPDSSAHSGGAWSNACPSSTASSPIPSPGPSPQRLRRQSRELLANGGASPLGASGATPPQERRDGQEKADGGAAGAGGAGGAGGAAARSPSQSRRGGGSAAGQAAWQRAREKTTRSRRRDSIIDRIYKPLNRWQKVVISSGFRALLARRLTLLRRLRAVFAPVCKAATMRHKLSILRPLKLFQSLAYREAYSLARMMSLKLLPRYSKAIRAGCAPPAFYVVVWGNLRYMATRDDGLSSTKAKGDCFGEGALAAALNTGPTPEGDEAAAAAAAAAVAEASAAVPLEPYDLQCTEPTLLLSLRTNDVDVILHPWFIGLQRRYVASQLKSDMLLRAPSFESAGFELCSALASCFTVQKAPAGMVLYKPADRPDAAYLLIDGAVELLTPPAGGASNPFAPKSPLQPHAGGLVVMRRTHTSECAWVGEGALFHGREPPGSVEVSGSAAKSSTGGATGYRRSHTARTTRASQLLKLPKAAFPRFERLAHVLLPMLRNHDRRLEELVANPPLLPPPAEGDGDAGLAQMQTVARELALAARERLADQKAAHAKFKEDQQATPRAVFIYNLASAYNRNRYKRLQEGEKAARSPSPKKVNLNEKPPEA